MNVDRATGFRSVRVARYASPREEEKYGVAKLHALAERGDRLRQAYRRPAPVGVREREHAEHVHEELAGDRDRELGRPRKVGLRRLTRPVLLREDDLLVRAVRGSPHLDPTLECPKLTWLVPVRVLLDEELEERLRLERRRLDEPRLDLRPVLGERIFPRPPVSLLHHVRRQLAGGDVLPRCLSIHPRTHRRQADAPVFAHLFH